MWNDRQPSTPRETLSIRYICPHIHIMAQELFHQFHGAHQQSPNGLKKIILLPSMLTYFWGGAYQIS